MKKITLAVDGNGLLKQSFHGNTITHEDNKFGYIGATQTFITIIRKMIREYNVNKVIVFWDGLNGGKLRYNIYPYYKEKRNKNWNGDDELVLTDGDIKKMEFFQKNKNEEAMILFQKLRIQQYCEELFIRQYEFPQIESDDSIAYYVKYFKESDEEVIIYSGDEDMFMLIDYDNVSVYSAQKKQIVNKYNFDILFHDYNYKNVALIKAITGCTSDNVYGVDSIGVKTLLKHFPELKDKKCDIDFILTKAKEINSNRKKPLVALENLIEGKTSVNIENILNGKHLFDLNYKLVNLLDAETFMTDEAIEHLELVTTALIDPENRGGKNIIKLMMEDGFIKYIPRGADGYSDFLKQFLLVVNSEKKYYNDNV